MKKLVIAFLSSIVFLTTAFVADGAVEYPAGGEWKYGVGVTGSYSNYLHNTRRHSATVKKGSKEDYEAKSAKEWAKARLFEYSGCEFFYNVL